MHEEELDVDLSRVTAATTVVSGRHDLDFFQDIARYLTTELPEAVHVDLPWAGHLPNFERPAETHALIARSISRLSDTTNGEPAVLL